MEKNSTFCVLPWMHVACNSSGNLRLCCNSTPTKNLILDADGRPFKLNKDISSFDDAYNSDWMKKIRQDMLIGNKVSICERCYTEEESGVRSARQAWNEKYYEKVATEVQMTAPDGACDFKPIYMDLRLGNLCNLKCRMCNPYASKKWLEDWGKVESLEELSSDEIKRLSAMNWFDEDAFVQNLMSVIGSVEEIYFTGGEPLLIKKQFQLLEMLIEKNYAKNITIKYNTNATFVPEKALIYWSKFKKVIINASVDGVGAVNEYIRNPSVWSEIDKNLRLLDVFIKDSENATGSIHTTVQLYNLEHLLPLFNYVKKFNGFQKFPFLNILNHPQYLNIRNAPPTLKKAISKEILDWHELYKIEFSDEHQFAKLKEVVEYLNSKDLDYGNDFLLYSNEVDVLRKEEVSKVVPRLHSAITAPC